MRRGLGADYILSFDFDDGCTLCILISYVVAAAKSLQSCLTFCDHMDCSLPGFFGHEDSPGKNTGVSCHALIQGIFPTSLCHVGNMVTGVERVVFDFFC